MNDAEVIPRRSELRRLFILFGALASASFAAWLVGFDVSALFDGHGLQSAHKLFTSLLHPDFSRPFLARIGHLALESILIGVLGMTLALVLGIALAIGAADMPRLDEAPVPSRWGERLRLAVRGASRATLSLCRSIPEIVWAYLFVRVFGLGPGPAVFAIGITFGGIIGKLFSELVEAVDPIPARRLRASGAGSLAVFLYGVFPQVSRQWVGYALFRLECAIRSASILGVVGAGGLGAEIELSIRYFQYDKLATALLAVLAYVVLLDILSVGLRKLRPRWSAIACALGAAVAVALLDIPWTSLFGTEERQQAMAFLRGFGNPLWDGAFLRHAVWLALLTVAMAWSATVVAAIFAFFLAPLGAIRFAVLGFLQDAPGRSRARQSLALVVFLVARVVLQLTRALPELVWALLFIVWVGPGITAGVLALAVHSVGILGRLYGDILDEAEPGLPRALESGGAGAIARYLYGVLPQVMPRMLAFTLFRFEVNIRAATMIGFVGAGGLGDSLHTAISLFHMRELASLLLLLLLVVLVVDSLGDRARRRLL